jgi:hypothetical protein
MKFSYIILIFLIFVSAFQFSSLGITGEPYLLSRNLLIINITILFIVSYHSPTHFIKTIPSFRIHFFGLLIFLFFLIFFSIGGFEINFNPARDLALALVVLMIGLNMHISEKQFTSLVNIYILLYAISALSIVFTFSSGFEIQDRYLPIPKNQVAPAFGVASILSLYFGFMKKGFCKLYYYIITLLLLSSILVIRCRSIIVAVFLTILIFTFFYISNRKYKIIFIASTIILISTLGQFIYDAIFLNFDVSDIDSITTGRVSTYEQGINFILEYPFGGMLEGHYSYGSTIHNYILYNIVNYGVFISFVLFVIYFKYIFTIINGIRNNSLKFYEVGPLVMVVIMIASLFEYTYPYSPGSAIFFPFFLIGQYFNKQSLYSKISGNTLI